MSVAYTIINCPVYYFTVELFSLILYACSQWHDIGGTGFDWALPRLKKLLFLGFSCYAP